MSLVPTQIIGVGGFKGGEPWISTPGPTHGKTLLEGTISSGVNGSLRAEFSSNGEVWETAADLVEINDRNQKSFKKTFNKNLVAPFVRLVFTNDSAEDEEYGLEVIATYS